MNRRTSARKSTLPQVLRALGAAVVFCAAVGSGLMAYELVREQQYLVVKDVVVTGNVRVSAEEVLDYAQIDMGESLYRVNTDVVLRSVMKHPDLASATVSRVPPDGIKIVVQEHVPAASIAMGQGIYVVNTEGRMFRRALPGESLDLPPITGIPRAMFNDDGDGARRMLALAMRALKAHQDTGRPPEELGEIEVDEHFGITVQLGEPATEVALGMEGFPEKFARLRVLENHLKRKQQVASRIFLDNARHPERVAVELKSPILAAAQSAAAPRH